VHVAVPRDRVGNREAITILSPVDQRVMFVLPAGAHTIVGTTDTPTPATPDDVRADEADVAYILRSANHFFPSARLERNDVVSAWAGIRPLIASGYGAAATSASREHSLTWSAAGVLAVSGGKLTTYRAMAQEAVDAVASRLGGAPKLCATERIPLPGGELASLPEEIAEARRFVAHRLVAAPGAPATPRPSPAGSTSAPDTAYRLVTAYGSAWRTVWERAERDPALRELVAPGLPYIMAEMAHGVERERACTLADLLVRRTHVAYETRDNGREAARQVAATVAPLLGWDGREEGRQIEAYDQEMTRLFAVDAAPAGATSGGSA
jgi:glycerol-3-phosphate dehydrogenase